MTVSLQSAPLRMNTSCTTLKTKLSSGIEQTSLAFRKDVHFFCRVRWPPRSPCEWEAREHIKGMWEERKANWVVEERWTERHHTGSGKFCSICGTDFYIFYNVHFLFFLNCTDFLTSDGKWWSHLCVSIGSLDSTNYVIHLVRISWAVWTL